MTYRRDDKRGGCRATGTARKSGSHAARCTHLRYRIWCAERIGWPALAESFRRELRAMGEAA